MDEKVVMMKAEQAGPTESDEKLIENLAQLEQALRDRGYVEKVSEEVKGKVANAEPLRGLESHKGLEKALETMMRAEEQARRRFQVHISAFAYDQWGFSVLPFVTLVRNPNVPSPLWKYRLAIGWGFWGFSIGFGPRPQVMMAASFKGTVTRFNPEKGVFEKVYGSSPAHYSDFDPNEANERP